MTPETLTCAENITPERLSALRDDALASAEAQRLRNHIATCAACQARLADYDAMATALRLQRELEPGERIVNGVRARIAAGGAATRRRVRPSRRLWRGVATLAPVAAIILLFVYVFSGLAGRMRPTGSGTPTASVPTATNSTGKPNIPTTTPQLVTLPPFTPSVTADTAWGTLAPVATFQTPNVANTAFSFDALSPDATTFIGTETTNMNPGSGAQSVYLISYDIASHTYRRLGPHWSGYIGPWGGANGVSARYISYGFNSAPGTTCGVCNNTLWSYDRQTGGSWEFDPGKLSGAQYSGSLGDITSADHVAFTSNEEQVWVADLATHQVRLALPIGAQPANATTSTTSQPGVRLVGFTWPNLIYTYSPVQTDPNTPVATTLRITNVQTNSTTIFPTPLPTLLGAQTSDANLDWATISGATLYFTTYTEVNGVDASGASVTTGYGMLFRISLSSSSTGRPEMLARWQELNHGQSAATGSVPAHAANGRLIILDGSHVWDIAESKLVQLPTPGTIQTPLASLSGNYLLLTHGANVNNPQVSTMAGAIYDTAALPVR
ncbi:MAG TPA: zf-HC2 domain-containing protein [Ktedonobacterales bacterium]|nr:zf-HC2 domain-containing protein [Ktedonobacterales bacterium]